MRPFRQYRAGFAWTAAVAMATTSVSPLTALAAETKTKVSLVQAMKRTVLVFPFDVPGTVGNADEVRALLSDMALSRLQASGNYSVTMFHRSLPTVARLVLDQQLTDADVTPNYAEDNTKGIKIAKAAGYDAIFLGAIDDYQFDEDQKQAKVLVRGAIIDVKTGRQIGTGVTLQAASTTGGTAKEPTRALEAARSAGEQLMTKLVPVVNTTVEPVVKPVTKPAGDKPKRKRNNDWLWGVLAVGLGLGIGLSTSGGGGGGGGGVDNPPPPP